MKRLFILASAALMLASCAKTTVVYNEAPEEISFKQVTNVMTKETPVDELAGHTSMGVFAYLNSEEYFGNTSFTPDALDDPKYWTSATPKYWPVSGSLDFTVYAPFTEGNVTVSYAEGTKTLTINADNKMTPVDWLYGTTQPQSGRKDGAVDVALAHALSLVEINVKGENATLKGINLLNTNQKGVGTITYPAANVVWVPDNTSPRVDKISLYTPTNADSGDALSAEAKSESRLVIPTGSLTNEVIELVYRLSGSNADLTYTTTIANPSANPAVPNDLGATWAHGKKYIYNITITPKEIKFNPTVTAWDANTDGNAGDDKKDINI